MSSGNKPCPKCGYTPCSIPGPFDAYAQAHCSRREEHGTAAPQQGATPKLVSFWCDVCGAKYKAGKEAQPPTCSAQCTRIWREEHPARCQGEVEEAIDLMRREGFDDSADTLLSALAARDAELEKLRRVAEAALGFARAPFGSAIAYRELATTLKEAGYE